MGIRDRLADLGVAALGAAGGALAGFAKAYPAGKYDVDEGPETSPGGTDEDTAESHPVPQDNSPDDPKALFWDPFSIISAMGYKERPSQISYATLRAMVWRMPIVQAIIQTRINQVASFSKPQRDRYGLGFRIQTRDPRKQPSKAEVRWIEQMSALIQRTGVTESPRGRDTFEKLLRKVIWDSYVYDQLAIEIVPDKKGRPCEWYAVDAATIRLADTARNYVPDDDLKTIRQVQVYDGMIVAEYALGELAFGVRNPRSDLRAYGYGVSELEMLVSTITALLWGFEYNMMAFRQGSVHKGLLNFKGTIPDKQMKQFRRFWYQMLSGIENAWKTPITNADDVQWVPMHTTNRDMEYNAWIDFQIKVACSMYQIDPVEVNFKYGNVGQKSGLTEASNKEKITESKERGLRPMLRFLADIINQFIIWPINESFEFEFVGLDARSPEQAADLAIKQVKAIKTVDEIRAEDDLPPLPDGKGEVILDPTWLQFSQAKEAAAQPQGPGGPGGPPGGPGGGPKEPSAEPSPGGMSQDELAQLFGEGGEGGSPEGGATGPNAEADAAKQEQARAARNEGGSPESTAKSLRKSRHSTPGLRREERIVLDLLL
jgi:hypothetical protein